MKRYPFYLFVIAALIAVVFVCDRAIVNEAIGQVRPLKIKPLKMIIATGDCLIYHIPVLYQDILSPKPEKPEWLKRFTSDYREYSAECYADSTKVRMGYFWQFNGEIFKAIYKPKGGEMVHNLKEVRDEYIHREPIFTGFMEFLDKKYK